MTQGVLLLLPLGETPAWGRKLLTFCIEQGVAYFPMRLVMENQGKAIVPGRPYVIGKDPCRCCLYFAMLDQSAALRWLRPWWDILHDT